FFFTQTTASEVFTCLEFRRVLFRSLTRSPPPALRTPHGTPPAVRSGPRPRPGPTARHAGPTASRTAALSHRPAQPSHHPRTAATPRPAAPGTPRPHPDRGRHRPADPAGPPPAPPPPPA